MVGYSVRYFPRVYLILCKVNIIFYKNQIYVKQNIRIAPLICICIT